MAFKIISEADTADPLTAKLPFDGRSTIWIDFNVCPVFVSVKAKSDAANVLIKFADGVLSPEERLAGSSPGVNVVLFSFT